MADSRLVMAPRVPTPEPGVRVAGTSGRIADELLTDQVKRLAVFSAVVAGVWTWGLAMTVVIVPLLVGQPRQSASIILEISAIGVSSAMYLYIRRVPHAPETKTAVGLAYMVFNALSIAVLNTLTLGEAVHKGPHVSWTAVLILVFSMISPASPVRMLAASLVAASMDPLVTGIARQLGLPALPATAAVVHFLPNYVCAFVAIVTSRIYQRLGRRLREAQALGSYTLVEPLGQGGMGEVWRAEHRLLARSAAIKLVHPQVLGASNEAEARTILRRFEREARATAALSSPHTIQIFDFGVTNDGNFYYVMELLSGRDLDSLVRDFGPLPADRTVFLLRQICHSLADAHARGFVHRDIKPANIYVCRMGLDYDFVKVLDFGLVKVNDAGTAQRTTQMTVDHRTMGTPAYMAPEIILGEADVDRRADVYALGCVVYYLLTGQVVFEADTPMKMLMQHVQATPVPPSRRTELPIPKELDEVVLRCLQKDPSKRPQHAEELLDIAYSACSCGGWTRESSGRWWEQHLPDLTGPLTVGEPRTESVGRIVSTL